jgi:tRNA modification GTPase
VLELQAHGGPVVLQLLLARCLEAGRAIGLRVAEPGEFTSAPTSTTSSTWRRPRP